MLSLLVSGIVFLCILGSAVGQLCTTLPTNAELTTELGTRVGSDAGGEGAGAVLSDVGGPYYTCQAQGSSKDIYRELSVIMTYTATVGGVPTTGYVKQFELDCMGGTWVSRTDSLSTVPTDFVYTNLTPMTACGKCIDTAPDNYHCQACDPACTAGLMSCTGATATDCCAAFDSDASGSCLTTTTCSTANYVATAATNWECQCGQLCGAGTQANVACNGCDISNICLANNPCLNGGDCTLNTPPDMYTCSCISSYIGPTCSVCNHTCTAGYAVNTACNDCDLTSICVADEPCMNGGVCSLNGAPELYICDCSGTNHSGMNCDVCSFPCDSGYEPNPTCSGCMLSDICVADNPCVNNGNCTLNLKPDNYNCSCVNDFTPASNCSECGLNCPPGYTNDTNCDECVLSDICEADTPCQNGGTCTLGSVPDQFTCSCLNSFTPGSNCTECSLACNAGYVQNDQCSSCKLNDICVANSPCQNGGTCELGLKPDNFTCLCTNSFDASSNCSECSLDCEPGHDHDTDCTECSLSNICLASDPCLNGATCTLGVTPSQYTCTCTNKYSGTNCSDCPLTCNTGYKVDSVCNGCELENKCLADTPCENGGTCDLTTPPDQYECQCINLFDESTDCKVCLKSCPAGYRPDSVCSDECVLTSICNAISPCKNGGECVLGDPVDQYQCDCDKSFFTGTNCTDCNKECSPGYTLDPSTCICDLTDICEANAPCQNGATCSLVDSAPDKYDCACRNQFGNENCATCMLECNHGKPDMDCKSCECAYGYTGEDCTTIDNCARSWGQCSGRGDCTNLEREFVCNCHAGATGQYCQFCVDGYTEHRNRSCVPISSVSDDGQDFSWWYALVPAVGFLAFVLVMVLLVVMFMIVRAASTTSATQSSTTTTTARTSTDKIPLA